ncbi:MAG: metallophosphoesterase family protein [Planctomycetaceae bacterium]
MRIAWITDPHLNHCPLPAWERLMEQVAIADCQAMVITGDISEGEDVVFQLRRLADSAAIPIYFVLGNHDFYHGSIQRTREAVSAASTAHPLLHYLRDESIVELSPAVALIGEDGWGDATEGDYSGSIVVLNDFRLIEDFTLSSPSQWQGLLQAIGNDSTERLRRKLDLACRRYSSILIATHVPPLRESCWYQGHTTDDHWAPFFVCGQMGKMLLQVAAQYPDTIIEVLCGHTHHGGVARMSPNLTITTGGAEYGHPVVTDLVSIESEPTAARIQVGLQR